jgi:hypothetical protein
MATGTFGIDTFDNHLDSISQVVWNLFKEWNGGQPSMALNGGQPTPQGVSGGDPTFAGRNFLGGDFLWGHAEATDAMTNPSPKDFSKLNRRVTRVAPIQAPQPERQQVKGERGVLYGQIDATALCARLFRSIVAGEFDISSWGFVNVWLAVDPDVELSLEYWAGWADTVNKFSPMTLGLILPDSPAMQSPFGACILCRYTPDATGKLRRDAHVNDVLSAVALVKLANVLVSSTLAKFQWADMTCYNLWADAPDPDANGVRPNPVLDWGRFDPAEVPLPSLWRCSTSFQMADGTAADAEFSVDAMREPEIGLSKATDLMLVTRQWQPTIPSSALNLGFVVYIDHSPFSITSQQITRINANDFPQLVEASGNYTVPSGPVKAVGRYLKGSTNISNMSEDEAQRLSAADFVIFTTWEHFEAGDPSQPLSADYFDPAHAHGTRDGENAFRYCGEVLHQPPQTPIFFAVDFPAADTDVQHASPHIKDWIEAYFKQIKDARDAYAQRNPDRYYLIGVYGTGGVLEWCYRQGYVSFFWQSLSTGTAGNVFPSRPWCHDNRFQFNREIALKNANWNVVPGADPDMDWGDGGTWTLLDPLAQNLLALEVRELQLQLQRLFQLWGPLLRLHS